LRNVRFEPPARRAGAAAAGGRARGAKIFREPESAGGRRQEEKEEKEKRKEGRKRKKNKKKKTPPPPPPLSLSLSPRPTLAEQRRGASLNESEKIARGGCCSRGRAAIAERKSLDAESTSRTAETHR